MLVVVEKVEHLHTDGERALSVFNTVEKAVSDSKS